MYAIAFDLIVAETEKHHPKGVSQAYAEIGMTLAEYGVRLVSPNNGLKITFLNC